MYNECFNGVAARTSKPAASYMPVSKFGKTEDEVQTIIGKTVEDCKRKLYAAYGHNYTILDRKAEFKGGFLGFGQKEIWKVSYVIGSPMQTQASAPAVSEQEKFTMDRDEILKKANITTTIQVASLDKKVDEMKKLLESSVKTMAEATKVGDKHPSIQKIEEILQENEFTFAYINKITTRLKQELTVEELENFDFVQEKVVDYIGESISITPKSFHKYPHVIILIGPTGVGKTTTIAKLAGTMIKNAKDDNLELPKIRMITVDKVRVGAKEQLGIYGSILETPVDDAESAEDVKTIFDTYKDTFDVLFIDTPGYSPNDFENIGKMRKMLEVKGISPDIYLTFMASSKARDMKAIIQNYEPFGYSSVIITKWDETSAIGNVISVLSEKGKSISYITDGQLVPTHIERATIQKFLMNLNSITVNREHIEEKFNSEKNEKITEEK